MKCWRINIIELVLQLFNSFPEYGPFSRFSHQIAMTVDAKLLSAGTNRPWK